MSPGVPKRLMPLAQRVMPPAAARLAKRLLAGPRYRRQLAAAAEGFRRRGNEYPVTTLFVAGLPKSGTTWLEKMLACYDGFENVMIPEIAAHEMRTGGSHDFDMPPDMFHRFRDALVVCKLHVHGSAHNRRLLREAGLPYTVLFRDLRDVAVSNYHYVRSTPWHPEHPRYAGRSLLAGLALFAERTLGDYAGWVRSWHEDDDGGRRLLVRYEMMLADPRDHLERVARHYRLPGDPETIDRIARATSFEAMSGGRKAGQDGSRAFVRKGIAGDWKNHFDERTKELYKQIIGDYLIEFGYEKDTSW